MVKSRNLSRDNPAETAKRKKAQTGQFDPNHPWRKTTAIAPKVAKDDFKGKLSGYEDLAR